MSRSWFKFNLSYPLTLLGSLFFLIVGSFAMVSLYEYLRLSATTEVMIDQWKVIKKSSSSYSIRGNYHFEFRGRWYESSSFLQPPYHLNRPSAEKAIKKLKQTKTIWLDPYQPTVSSLEKSLPIKQIVYALMALGVTLYFGFVETSSRIRNPIN